MAVLRQNPSDDLIFHNDRGVQYASKQYREALASFNITQCMSRKGDPYDNAVAENFFSCLKCEHTHYRHYRTKNEAQTDIFAYIESYYNSARPHSTLGWLTPNSYEKHMLSVYALSVGVVGFCQGTLPLGCLRKLPKVTTTEALCQVNRGINADDLSKSKKNYDSFRFIKHFCVYFFGDGSLTNSNLFCTKNGFELVIKIPGRV